MNLFFFLLISEETPDTCPIPCLWECHLHDTHHLHHQGYPTHSVRLGPYHRLHHHPDLHAQQEGRRGAQERERDHRQEGDKHKGRHTGA